MVFQTWQKLSLIGNFLFIYQLSDTLLVCVFPLEFPSDLVSQLNVMFGNARGKKSKA